MSEIERDLISAQMFLELLVEQTSGKSSDYVWAALKLVQHARGLERNEGEVIPVDDRTNSLIAELTAGVVIADAMSTGREFLADESNKRMSDAWGGTRSARCVMLCWTPGTDKVGLVAWPDTTGKSDLYEMSDFACFSHVREFNNDQLTAYCFITATQLVVRDACDSSAVHTAMMGVHEYREALASDVT